MTSVTCPIITRLFTEIMMRLWVDGQVDPSPESAESMTGYQYAMNSPMMMNDPLGDKARLPVDIPATGNPGFSSKGTTPDITAGDMANEFGTGFGGIPMGGGGFMGIPGATNATIYNVGDGSIWSPAVGSLGGGIQAINSMTGFNVGSSVLGTQGLHYTNDNGQISAMPNGFAGDSYSVINHTTDFYEDGSGHSFLVDNRSETQVNNFNVSANQKDGGQQTNYDNGSWWQHLIGPAIFSLGAPFPKPWVAANSSPFTSIASSVMRRLIPEKILLEDGTRRLFTHTVNGAARYASTYGVYYGRMLSEWSGTVGIALMLGDLQSWGFHKVVEQAPENRKDDVINGFTFGL